MDSNKKSEGGELHNYTELESNGVVLKKERNYKVLEPLREGSISQNSIRIMAELEGIVPIKAYVNAKWRIGISMPVDIRKVELKQAYREIKDIVMEEVVESLDEVKDGIYFKEDPSKTGFRDNE